MNKALFFSSVRNSLFGGKLTQGVVDTLNSIIEACDVYGVDDVRQVAYILATAKHESYHFKLNPEWLPVREGWAKTNAGAIAAVTALYKAKKISVNYALPIGGLSYYGRGFAQITHLTNYIRVGKRIAIDLKNNPDLALKRDVAANIIVDSMSYGTFTGKALHHYFNEQITDPLKARKIVNGMDQAERIKAMYSWFLIALRA